MGEGCSSDWSSVKAHPPGFITLESGLVSLWKPDFVLSRLEECPKGAQVLCSRTVLIGKD